MDSWLSYWNAPNKIYVSERHKRVHYDLVFAGVAPHLPDSPGVILDWGCGDALAADRIAERCSMVFLYDAAESARARLRCCFESHSRIRILEKSGLDDLASGSVDLIIVNSVIQYLSDEQLDEALVLFHRVVKPGSTFLLGDVISPGTGNSHHVTTFLRFAWQNSFLLSAIGGLVKTFMSPYRNLQREVGFATFTPEQMLDKLESHGFEVDKLARNIGANNNRSAYLARKPDKDAAFKQGKQLASVNVEPHKSHCSSSSETLSPSAFM
jgi:SAM-dependent methyltransferase